MSKVTNKEVKEEKIDKDRMNNKIKMKARRKVMKQIADRFLMDLDNYNKLYPDKLEMKIDLDDIIQYLNTDYWDDKKSNQLASCKGSLLIKHKS